MSTQLKEKHAALNLKYLIQFLWPYYLNIMVSSVAQYHHSIRLNV